jgi:hypothetical protein
MKTLQILLILIALSFTTKAQTFEDINASLPGLTFSVSSFGDFDGDGDLDLYLSGYDDSNTVSGGIYVYDNDTYTLSGTANVTPVYMGSADWGDIDGDGDLDLAVLGSDPSYSDVTIVYENNGDGTFSDINAGLPPAEQGEITFADIDNDGDLDLTLTGIGASDRITKFFTNDGAGNFTEITSLNLPGMNLGRIKWADYDNDNDLDFVLTGYDDGTGGSDTFFSEIYTNNGDGTFSVSGINLHKGWLGDTEWGDYNADGNIDLIISGTGGDGSERFTLLYKNNGDGTFSELDPGFPGVSHSSIEWADFDGDGDLDVFIVGETTTPGDGNSISKIFNNDGNDSFSDSGLDVFSYSYYGDADSGDIDGDGKVDLVITGYSEAGYASSSSAVYLNTSTVSVSLLKKNKLRISPVPAKEYITVICPENINKLVIYNVSGKTVFSQNSTGQTVTVNTSGLSSGVYFVQILTETETISEKIIIE